MQLPSSVSLTVKAKEKQVMISNQYYVYMDFLLTFAYLWIFSKFKTFKLIVCSYILNKICLMQQQVYQQNS